MVAYTLVNDLLLSAVLGFCTYLALPVVKWPYFTKSRAFVVFNAIAIGILAFLLLDIYTDVFEDIFPNDSMIADAGLSLAFIVCVVIAFLIPLWTEGEEGEEAGASGDRTALAVAVGIGFQNLTEGLAFGAAWYLAKYDPADFGLATIILVGYGIQNMTEGFPIIAAYIGKEQPSWGKLIWLFFVRGIPTVIGGLVGYEAVSSFVVTDMSSPNYGLPTYGGSLIDTAINGLAIGSILFCILPILLASFRSEATEKATHAKRTLIFLGILAGFVIGFGVGLF